MLLPQSAHRGKEKELKVLYLLGVVKLLEVFVVKFLVEMEMEETEKSQK